MSVSDVCFECMSSLLSYHLNLSLACALGLSDQTPPGLEDTDACSLPLVCGESLPVLASGTCGQPLPLMSMQH